MLDKIKYFAKLSSMAVMSLAKIYLLVFFSTIISLTLSIIFLLRGDNPDVVAPHAGGPAGILAIIVAKPIESLLIFLIFICSVMSVSFGYKYVAKKIINRIINDKAEPLLYPLMDKVISKFRASQPAPIKTGGDYAIVKLKMIHNIKNESDNKWLKRALSYGFGKVNISDSDLKGDVDFYEVLKRKVINALENASKPSRTGIWVLVTLQLVFALIMAFI